LDFEKQFLILLYLIVYYIHRLLEYVIIIKMNQLKNGIISDQENLNYTFRLTRISCISMYEQLLVRFIHEIQNSE
jgi:hypothetical protein